MKKYNFNKIFVLIMFALVLLIRLININKGIDVTDTGFYLANYSFVNGSLSDIGLFMSNLLGGIIYHILPSHQLLVLKITDVLVYLYITYEVYKLFKDDMKSYILLPSLILSTIYLQRFPGVLNYNTFSILFLVIIIKLLLKSLKSNNNKLLLISGFLLGINIFIKLPNILEGLLFLSVVVFYVKDKKSFKYIFNKALIFGIGVLIGISFSLLLMLTLSGKDTIINSIREYIQNLYIPNNHSIKSTLNNIFFNLCKSIKFMIDNALLYIIPIVIVLIFSKTKKIPLLFRNTISITLGVISAYLIGTNTYNSIIYYFSLVSLLSLIMSIISLFDKKIKFYPYKIVLIINAIVVIILPLGTANGAYQYIIFSHIIIASLCYSLSKNKFFNNTSLSTLLIVIVLFTGLFLHKTLMTDYCYGDDRYSALDTYVDLPVLKGMKTTKTKANDLEQIYKYLNKKEFKKNKLISLGNFPIIYSLINNDNVFNYCWVDLSTFSIQTYENTIKSLKEEPIIILYGDFFLDGKDKILMDYIKNKKYKEIKEINYTIYIPSK